MNDIAKLARRLEAWKAELQWGGPLAGVATKIISELESEIDAQGTEARRAETTGSACDGRVANGDAPKGEGL